MVSTRAACCQQCGHPVDHESASRAKEFPSVVALPASPQEVLQQTEELHQESVPNSRPIGRWRTDNPAPWSRYAARMLDMALFGPLTMMLLVVFIGASFGPAMQNAFVQSAVFTNQLLAGIFAAIASAPLSGLILGWAGSTPGKYLFGVHVSARNGEHLGAARALAREIDVLVRGVALGVPIVAMFTQIVAYRRLSRSGSTSWDESGSCVVKYFNQTIGSRLRATSGVLLLLMLVIFYAATAKQR